MPHWLKGEKLNACYGSLKRCWPPPAPQKIPPLMLFTGLGADRMAWRLRRKVTRLPTGLTRVVSNVRLNACQSGSATAQELHQQQARHAGVEVR